MLALAASFVFGGCAASRGQQVSPAASAESADAEADVADAGEGTVCPPTDAGTLPDSGCIGSGRCNVVVVPVPCGPGVLVTSSEPSVWQCICSANVWGCNVVSGGLGLVGCSDGGDGG
ncbi:MAG: hypothetical protein ABSF69_25185 [Polyangiaceae bacterium]|jgi:hypothetical protein